MINNDFKVEIGVGCIQQITSETPLMTYFMMIEAPKMTVVHRNYNAKWAQQYIKKDQKFGDKLSSLMKSALFFVDQIVIPITNLVQEWKSAFIDSCKRWAKFNGMG